MRLVRSILAAAGIGLALAGAAGCQAKLAGARCPCIEPEYTCIENACVPTRDLGDASFGPDANLSPDGGFLPDSGFVPDAAVDADAGL